jgi:hypothetical protein
LFIAFNAIPTQAQFHFGADAGYTNSHFNVKNPKDIKITSKECPGFQFTVIASYLHNDILWLESGLTFECQGISFDPDLTNGYIDTDEETYDPFSKFEVKTNSIEMPLWIGVKINLSKDFSILPKGGLFFINGYLGKSHYRRD